VIHTQALELLDAMLGEVGSHAYPWLREKDVLELAKFGTCVRYLRARDGVVKDALPFLLNHFKWRLETFPVGAAEVREELLKGKYELIEGRDLAGNVTLVVHGKNLGTHTYTDLVNVTHAVAYAFERLTEGLGPLEKFTTVYSRVDCSSKNLDLPWAKMIATMLQNNYPERMYKAMVFPSNFAFDLIWRIARLFFDAKTADKITLLADGKDLLKYIPADTLPVDLGGRYTQPFDPYKTFALPRDADAS
jgi:hypothetical protein